MYDVHISQPVDKHGILAGVLGEIKFTYTIFSPFCFLPPALVLLVMCEVAFIMLDWIWEESSKMIVNAGQFPHG